MLVEMLLEQAIWFIILIIDVIFVNTWCQLLYFYRDSSWYDCYDGLRVFCIVLRTIAVIWQGFMQTFQFILLLVVKVLLKIYTIYWIGLKWKWNDLSESNDVTVVAAAVRTEPRLWLWLFLRAPPANL